MDPRPKPLKTVAPELWEQRIDGEQVYAGALLNAWRDRVRLPDGHETVREYIVHPGAVLVIPVLDDGRLVVERQFRYPLQRVFVEFPAGKVDEGEDPLVTAERELIEETGYSARVYRHLGVLHPVISYSTEAIQMYVAQDLTHVGTRLDHGEFLEVDTMTVDQMLAALDRGEISDAKTMVALLLYVRKGNASTVAERWTIRGRVQGVGYRYAMIQAATAVSARGWVRNRADGTVQAFVQGDEETLRKLKAWCRKGPDGARVDVIDTETMTPEADLTAFVLRATFE
ncbi:MAG TPA: acylphosphatase [Casimicrobiaceae bacterium]|nr:acylphosphatase [Casimicrobiaceae bacterium]